MGTINQTKTPKTTAHKNFMAGSSFFLKNPIHTLEIAATSCFFGEPQYYRQGTKDRSVAINRNALSAHEITLLNEHLEALDPKGEWRSQSSAEIMEAAIDAALDFDVEQTLQFARRLRNEHHIRVTPQVILVRAANHPKAKGTGLIRLYAKGILKRADEPATGLAYQMATYGKPIPNSLKKAWADYLPTLDEYKLAKYRTEGREIKLVDVVNIAHPKASDPLAKLVKKQLSLGEETWEALISKKGSSLETWTEALDKMGHMALLRNVRNLLQKGVDQKLFLLKLKEGAAHGQQLPFRYVSAYEAAKAAGFDSPLLLDTIEDCLEISLGNLPKFPGRVMSLCDNSGSAQGTTTSSLGTMTIAKIANLTGIITGKQADEGYVGIFGDNLKVEPIRKKGSIFDMLGRCDSLAAEVGQGTEHGIWLFWDQAIKQKEHWDHVFIYSDQQAGHGGLYGTNPETYRDYWYPGHTGRRHIDVSKLINRYRRDVNPNVMVYLVQVAGYTDVILPEFYNRTYILGGWSENVLRFAARMSGIYNSLQQEPQMQ